MGSRRVVGKHNIPKQPLQQVPQQSIPHMGNLCQRPQAEPRHKSCMKQLKQLSSTISYAPGAEHDDILEIMTLTSQNESSHVTELEFPKGIDADLQVQGPKKLLSDFQPLRVLGKTNLGQIFLVVDTKTKNKTRYAMKVISKGLIKNSQMKSSALAERYLLEALDSPFLVSLYYAFQSKNNLYLLVDFMAGGQLFSLVRKERKFPEDVARFYAAEILLALEYLHNRNIIYRDLKPENILLTQSGHIKIADFGLSKICFNKNQLAFSICGTPEYIAPEIIQGKGYDKSSDFFSFGSLLYNMLVGTPPFYSKNKHEILLNIVSKEIPLPDLLSPDAQSLLTGLFQKKPANRLGSLNGVQEIKEHPFFSSIDFGKLEARQLQPPIKIGKTPGEARESVELDPDRKVLDISQEDISGDEGVFKNFEYFKSENSVQGSIQIREDLLLHKDLQPKI